MANKNIQVLSDFEHILKRPTIYVGSVKISEEMVPIIKEDIISFTPLNISVGMYKLFDEVFSNCVDEAKRMKKPMEKITIKVDSKKNSISIEDSGEGFTNASSINAKSKLSNVATAVSMLRAGSNFDNENISETLIGTNGMGVSLVNALSAHFSIETTNPLETYFQEWNNFIPSNEIIKKRNRMPMGTKVSFIPIDDIFEKCRWDKEILKSMLILKKRVLETESHTKPTELLFFWDNKQEEINTSVLKHISYKTPIGELLIWEKKEDSGSISFVNSAICSGIHQKIIMDQINNSLEDSLAHHFYDFCLILNLSPNLVKFGDQNKTKFVSKREEVESIIISNFEASLKKFYSTPLYKKVKELVERRRKEGEIKKLRAERKKVNVKFSHKYFPATSRTADSFYIVEGLSALGSLLQRRDPSKEGAYALKGKIKNARSLIDLAENKEILEIMQILNLDPHTPNQFCPYEKIVIATDSDFDGHHIASLLISLFHNWFPWIIDKKMLFCLETPLISTGDKNKEYFYSSKEFEESFIKKKKTNIRYLKGLGSLSLEDWEYVMKNKKTLNVIKDSKAKHHLEIAFGKSADARKLWLSSFGYK